MKIVHFSGGRSSAMMLVRLAEITPPQDLLVVFCNTGKETEQTLVFVKQVQDYLKIPIHWLEYDPKQSRGYEVVNFETASRKGEPFKALIKKYKGLPNVRNRSCTGKLKIEIANKFVIDCKVKKADRDNYLGIRKDEPNRYFKKKFDTSANYIMPLFDWGVRKLEVLEFWQSMPFNLVDTKYGSNCDYCFQKPIPRLIHCIREFGEESVQWWVDAEFETGKCFHQNKIYMKDLVELAKQPQFFNQEIEETETIGCFCGD